MSITKKTRSQQQCINSSLAHKLSHDRWLWFFFDGWRGVVRRPRSVSSWPQLEHKYLIIIPPSLPSLLHSPTHTLTSPPGWAGQDIMVEDLPAVVAAVAAAAAVYVHVDRPAASPAASSIGITLSSRSSRSSSSDAIVVRPRRPPAVRLDARPPATAAERGRHGEPP